MLRKALQHFAIPARSLQPGTLLTFRLGFGVPTAWILVSKRIVAPGSADHARISIQLPLCQILGLTPAGCRLIAATNCRQCIRQHSTGLIAQSRIPTCPVPYALSCGDGVNMAIHCRLGDGRLETQIWCIQARGLATEQAFYRSQPGGASRFS